MKVPVMRSDDKKNNQDQILKFVSGAKQGGMIPLIKSKKKYNYKMGSISLTDQQFNLVNFALNSYGDSFVSLLNISLNVLKKAFEEESDQSFILNTYTSFIVQRREAEKKEYGRKQYIRNDVIDENFEILKLAYSKLGFKFSKKTLFLLGLITFLISENVDVDSILRE
ncbi:hypothetical protein QJU11_10110 [Pasteurella atlantica]|uniref:hypothetical protein n=1 Tax=Phocoenobacter atlanticus TaxID=3416742 RepID=UPI002750DECE|nr:hypothetical protein [Pasteurella atlantica]MDP8042545.1 hypothetical protein [Pasteurella atlantica]